MNIFIDAHACSAYHTLQSQLLKKWGEKSEEGWLVLQVGQYKRVEQVSLEEKTKKRNTLAKLSMQVIVFSGENPIQGLILVPFKLCKSRQNWVSAKKDSCISAAVIPGRLEDICNVVSCKRFVRYREGRITAA